MIRIMTMEDYDGVRELWMKIKGFGIRSIDDSREGVERFLKRNPTTSVVAIEDGKIVGSILCGHDGRRGCLYHVCVDEAYRMRGFLRKSHPPGPPERNGAGRDRVFEPGGTAGKAGSTVG